MLTCTSQYTDTKTLCVCSWILVDKSVLSRVRRGTITWISSLLLYGLKGKLGQILLSEMSLPGIEVLIEMLLPKGDWGRRTPPKDRADLSLYSSDALWHHQFRYNFCMLRTTCQAKISVCMQGSRECCPVCVPELFPEPFVRYSMAFRYSAKWCVTSHDTITCLLGTV